MLTIAKALSESGLPRLEARLLLIHAVPGLSQVDILAHPDRELTVQQHCTYTQLVSARKAGNPIAYILGKREFYSRWFEVNSAVLIPRPETEHLVAAALAYPAKDARVLDLGTGSGAIAVTLALERDQWDITAVDISEDALHVARRNAADLGASIRFLQGNWYDALPNGQRFHLIVSNPPYIASIDAHLTKGDLVFEPKIALTDGADGLTCLATIALSASAWLYPGGWLMVEHGYDQGERVRQYFTHAGLATVHTILDLAGHERVTLGQLSTSR